MALYTPFIERNVDKVAGAIQQRQQNQLVRGAYLGDPGAMEQLYSVNPQAAEQIRQSRMTQEQARQKASLEQQKAAGEQQKYVRAELEKAAKAMSKMPFEQAQQFAARTAQELGVEAPELTEDIHRQFVSAYGDKVSAPKFTNIKTTASGKLMGLNEKTGEYEVIPSEEMVAPPKGMRISFDEQGNPIVETGVSGELGRKAQGEVETDLLKKSEQVFQLENIMQNFDEEYQTIGKKLGALMTGGKSFLGLDVSPEDEEQYNKMIDQRANIGELTATIRNDLFGAALTATEQKSAELFLPDARSDDPLELKRKTERMLKTAKRAVARLNYIRKQGLEMNEISLSKMDDIMADRAKQLHEEIKSANKDMSDEDIKRLVLRSVRKEFGLVK